MSDTQQSHCERRLRPSAVGLAFAQVILTQQRHCERSEAIHGRHLRRPDCFASLAMTRWRARRP